MNDFAETKSDLHNEPRYAISKMTIRGEKCDLETKGMEKASPLSVSLNI